MIEESPVNSKPSTPTDKRSAQRAYPALEESPQPVILSSYPVILLPRDTNDLDDSDILSSYPVILSPRDTGDLDNSD